MAKISEVGRSKTQDTPPDHGTNTEYDPLLEGQPVELLLLLLLPFLLKLQFNS